MGEQEKKELISWFYKKILPGIIIGVAVIAISSFIGSYYGTKTQQAVDNQRIKNVKERVEDNEAEIIRLHEADREIWSALRESYKPRTRGGKSLERKD